MSRSLLTLFLLSCGAPPLVEPTHVPEAPKSEADPTLAASDPPSTPAVGTEEPEAQLTFSQQRFPGSVFPPPDPGAPFERSAHEGDGVFSGFFDAASLDKSARKKTGARNPFGLSEDFASFAVRRMVLHPHEASRFEKLTLAALDLGVLRVAHRPGAADVEEMGHKELLDRAGLVPKEDQADLVALMNEGFQPRHGRFGMFSLDTEVVPPRDDACTVAILRDGTVRIGPWPSIKSLGTEIVAYRQTPPCLVTDGVRHPKLEKPDRAPWAGQQADLKTRRRSAVGLTEDGRTLIYGVGEETEAETLAAGMRHAGAFQAAQLDINWNWTRFFLVEQTEDGARISGALEENMARDRGEYLTRPGARGFFYFTRRTKDASNSTRADAPE